VLSPDLRSALTDLVAIGELAADTPPAAVRDLVVTGSRDHTGLEELAGLETLSVIGAHALAPRAFAPLTRLRVLAVEHTAWAPAPGSLPAGLRVVILRACRVRDLTVLDGLTGLQVLDVSGNPLGPDADDLLERWRARGLVATADDAVVRALNGRLAAEQTGLACLGTAAACVLTGVGHERVRDPERVAVACTAAEVTAALDEGTLDVLLARQVR
jgi:hypothetical protein